jgi:SAM-dependent methyltransferase
MTENKKRLSQAQFGAHARNFVASPTHAKGYSLGRLVELVKPQSDWRVLDVATGGGHTALAFAGRVRELIASDLTGRMLHTAQQHIAAQSAVNLRFCQADAEHLPFSDHSFDAVTCRIAPHHFPDVGAFVSEAARVLKPGGILGVADNVVTGEPRVAWAINLIETFRDPSHHWAYTLDDWLTFFFAAGLTILHNEVFSKDTDFDEWAARVSVTGDDLTRLRALLLQSPGEAQEWLAPRQIGTRLTFRIWEAIVVGKKS